MHIKLMPRVKESERTSVFFDSEVLFREIEIECVCVTDLELSIKAAWVCAEKVTQNDLSC